MAPTLAVPLEENVPLAGLTTLGVGGPARYLARCRSADELASLFEWARQEGLATFILGGGSNLLVADAGFEGVVAQLTDAAIEVEQGEGEALVRAAAGGEWDAVVALSVKHGLGGLECLSGIPGRVGAAPIQNVGAYGQEVAETLAVVEVVDLATGKRREVAGEECGFAYRFSRFKGEWRGRFAVTRVDFRLPRRTAGEIRYPDLRRRLDARSGHAPSLAEVRQAVLAVRREKSMVLDSAMLDSGDPNRRSAGSFFLNPVVTPEQADEVRARARTLSDRPPPTFPAGDRVKLSAAWLIEAAGFPRGYRLGNAGLSTRHTLALVNRGQATAADLLALAAQIRGRVRDAFGVTLEPEPYFLGFNREPATILDDIDPANHSATKGA